MCLKTYLASAILALQIGLNSPCVSPSIYAAALEKISGKVIDAESKKVLERATVTAHFEKKQDLETILDSVKISTDTLGQFQFEIPEEHRLNDLYFSYVGYTPKSIEITEQTNFPIIIKLSPFIPEVDSIVVQNKSFNELTKIDYKKETGLDDNLNEVLEENYENFTLNDIQTILKSEIPSINHPQSDQMSSTLHIQGNRAEMHLDRIPLVNDSRLEVLGGTSMYTFDQIKVFENHTPEGGFPGSINITSKKKPQSDKITGVFFANPIIKEIYAESPIGDSAFVFVDFFQTDNSILKFLSDSLRVPNYSALEAKLGYWQGAGVKQASVYYLGSKAIVKEEINKAGISTNTRDNVIILNFESQPISLFGLLEYPGIDALIAHQNSWIGIGKSNNAIDIGLKKERTNISFGSDFFLDFSTIKARAGMQVDYIQLSGSLLEQTKVGDGGSEFLQSFEKLQVGSREIIFPLYLGFERDKFGINLKHLISNKQTAESIWGNLKIKPLNTPIVIGAGHVQKNPTDMELIDNRFVIADNPGVKKEQVNYAYIKTARNIKNKLRIEAGFYINRSLTNSLREPDYQDIINYNTPILDTLEFLENLRDNPGKLIPEPTFHLLKGERIGGRLFASTSLKGIDLKARIRYEQAYMEIPEWDYFHTTQDSAYFTNYEGTKITHPNSNGLSYEIGTKFRIEKLVHIQKPLSLEIIYRYSQGKPYTPTSLIPLQYSTEDGDIVITEDNRLLYLKQPEKSISKRFPGTHDFNLRLEMKTGSKSRVFFYVDNVLDNRAIIEEEYPTKHAILTNGQSWHNTHNYRFIGAGLEYGF